MTDVRPLVETTHTIRGETYRLAVLRGRDLEMMAPLLREVFGPRGFTPEWVRRKYSYEREGRQAFACLAFADDGRPVAVVGALPWPIRHGNRSEVATQLADCATAPAHRGRGLHARLIDLVHKVSAAAGMTFVFRFSNELAFKITTSKLGYTPLDDLVEFNVPVRTVWAERVARRTGLGRPYDRHVRQVIEPYVDSGAPLASSVLADGYAGVDRDAAFFEYKAAFEGSRVLNLDGARVWLRARQGLLVGDMDAGSDDELDQGLDSLVRIARKLGAHRVLFQVSPGTRLCRYLETRLIRTKTRHVSCFDLGSKIPSDALRFTFGDIDTF